ncbi:hypothetical protein NE237_021209 [Protea cynaroides]|uniref:Uncharacterized protein n=1 Tax=Protea cynaroides TaxID=273540 RepID=A0A9Q0HCR3_9MAGN|nr:hypothetical protein NE237_021209 [Protea cynaroides]
MAPAGKLPLAPSGGCIGAGNGYGQGNGRGETNFIFSQDGKVDALILNDGRVTSGMNAIGVGNPNPNQHANASNVVGVENPNAVYKTPVIFTTAGPSRLEGIFALQEVESRQQIQGGGRDLSGIGGPRVPVRAFLVRYGIAMPITRYMNIVSGINQLPAMGGAGVPVQHLSLPTMNESSVVKELVLVAMSCVDVLGANQFSTMGGAGAPVHHLALPTVNESGIVRRQVLVVL